MAGQWTALLWGLVIWSCLCQQVHSTDDCLSMTDPGNRLMEKDVCQKHEPPPHPSKPITAILGAHLPNITMEMLQPLADDMSLYMSNMHSRLSTQPGVDCSLNNGFYIKSIKQEVIMVDGVQKSKLEVRCGSCNADSTQEEIDEQCKDLIKLLGEKLGTDVDVEPTITIRTLANRFTLIFKGVDLDEITNKGPVAQSILKAFLVKYPDLIKKTNITVFVDFVELNIGDQGAHITSLYYWVEYSTGSEIQSVRPIDNPEPDALELQAVFTERKIKVEMYTGILVLPYSASYYFVLKEALSYEQEVRVQDVLVGWWQAKIGNNKISRCQETLTPDLENPPQKCNKDTGETGIRVKIMSIDEYYNVEQISVSFRYNYFVHTDGNLVDSSGPDYWDKTPKIQDYETMLKSAEGCADCGIFQVDIIGMNKLNDITDTKIVSVPEFLSFSGAFYIPFMGQFPEDSLSAVAEIILPVIQNMGELSPCTVSWTPTLGMNQASGTEQEFGTLLECKDSCDDDMECTGIDWNNIGDTGEQCFTFDAAGELLERPKVDHYEKVPCVSVDLPEYPQEAAECEDAVLQLRCPLGGVLQIHEADYGRVGKFADACKDISDDSCTDPNTLAAVQGFCQGKSECYVTANNEVFADSCPLQTKALSVSYSCIPQFIFFGDASIQMMNTKLFCTARGQAVTNVYFSVLTLNGSSVVDRRRYSSISFKLEQLPDIFADFKYPNEVKPQFYQQSVGGNIIFGAQTLFSQIIAGVVTRQDFETIQVSFQEAWIKAGTLTKAATSENLRCTIVKNDRIVVNGYFASRLYYTVEIELEPGYFDQLNALDYTDSTLAPDVLAQIDSFSQWFNSIRPSASDKVASVDNTVYIFFESQVMGNDQGKLEDVFKDFISNYTDCEPDEVDPNAPITEDGKTCVFPFEYEGETYQECTEVKSPGKPWCSHMAVYESSTIPDVENWSHCIKTSVGLNVVIGFQDDCLTPTGGTVWRIGICMACGEDPIPRSGIRPWELTDLANAVNDGLPPPLSGKKYRLITDESLIADLVPFSALFNIRLASTILANDVEKFVTQLILAWTKDWPVGTTGTSGITVEDGKTCVFPFSYEGVTYNGCTDVNNPPGEYWCSSTPEYVVGSDTFIDCKNYEVVKIRNAGYTSDDTEQTMYIFIYKVTIGENGVLVDAVRQKGPSAKTLQETVGTITTASGVKYSLLTEFKGSSLQDFVQHDYMSSLFINRAISSKDLSKFTEFMTEKYFKALEDKAIRKESVNFKIFTQNEKVDVSGIPVFDIQYGIYIDGVVTPNYLLPKLNLSLLTEGMPKASAGVNYRLEDIPEAKVFDLGMSFSLCFYEYLPNSQFGNLEEVIESIIVDLSGGPLDQFRAASVSIFVAYTDEVFIVKEDGFSDSCFNLVYFIVDANVVQNPFLYFRVNPETVLDGMRNKGLSSPSGDPYSIAGVIYGNTQQELVGDTEGTLVATSSCASVVVTGTASIQDQEIFENVLCNFWKKQSNAFKSDIANGAVIDCMVMAFKNGLDGEQQKTTMVYYQVRKDGVFVAPTNLPKLSAGDINILSEAFEDEDTRVPYSAISPTTFISEAKQQYLYMSASVKLTDDTVLDQIVQNLIQQWGQITLKSYPTFESITVAVSLFGDIEEMTDLEGATLFRYPYTVEVNSVITLTIMLPQLTLQQLETVLDVTTSDGMVLKENVYTGDVSKTILIREVSSIFISQSILVEDYSALETSIKATLLKQSSVYNDVTIKIIRQQTFISFEAGSLTENKEVYGVQYLVEKTDGKLISLTDVAKYTKEELQEAITSAGLTIEVGFVGQKYGLVRSDETFSMVIAQSMPGGNVEDVQVAVADAFIASFQTTIDNYGYDIKDIKVTIVFQQDITIKNEQMTQVSFIVMFGDVEIHPEIFGEIAVDDLEEALADVRVAGTDKTFGDLLVDVNPGDAINEKDLFPVVCGGAISDDQQDEFSEIVREVFIEQNGAFAEKTVTVEVISQEVAVLADGTKTTVVKVAVKDNGKPINPDSVTELDATQIAEAVSQSDLDVEVLADVNLDEVTFVSDTQSVICGGTLTTTQREEVIANLTTIYRKEEGYASASVKLVTTESSVSTTGSIASDIRFSVEVEGSVVKEVTTISTSTLTTTLQQSCNVVDEQQVILPRNFLGQLFFTIKMRQATLTAFIEGFIQFLFETKQIAVSQSSIKIEVIWTYLGYTKTMMSVWVIKYSVTVAGKPINAQLYSFTQEDLASILQNIDYDGTIVVVDKDDVRKKKKVPTATLR